MCVTIKYHCKLSWQEALDSNCTCLVLKGTYFPRHQQLILFKFYFCRTDILHMASNNLIPSTLPGRVGPQGTILSRGLWRAPSGFWGDFMTATLLKHPVHAVCLICDVNGITSEEGELDSSAHCMPWQILKASQSPRGGMACSMEGSALMSNACDGKMLCVGKMHSLMQWKSN